jgi:hypothetical protein
MLRGGEQLVKMSPIHTHEMDGAVLAVASHQHHDGVKEGRELRFRKFTRRHFKFTVRGGAKAYNVADTDVVWRVREGHSGAFGAEKTFVNIRIARGHL